MFKYYNSAISHKFYFIHSSSEELNNAILNNNDKLKDFMNNIS